MILPIYMDGDSLLLIFFPVNVHAEFGSIPGI